MKVKTFLFQKTEKKIPDTLLPSSKRKCSQEKKGHNHLSTMCNTLTPGAVKKAEEPHGRDTTIK